MNADTRRSYGIPGGPTTGRCMVNVFLSGRPCGAPATHAVAVGCIHEHVDIREVCDEHHQRLDGQRIVCRACRLHPEQPHQCVLHWRPVPRERVAS